MPRYKKFDRKEAAKLRRSKAAKTNPDVRPAISHEELAQLVAEPARFIKLCWPEMSVYPKQLEVIESVRDNAQTFVHAANEMGKTRIAAVTALWFFCRANPVYVVATSSSETQLRNILWNEIRKLVSSSRVKFPFEISDLLIRKLNPDPDSPEKYIPQNSIVGTVSRTVESFQGYHLPHDKARVLAIFEEASGIDDEFKTASDSWAHRHLVIGNPLSTTNFFYRGCKGGDTLDPSGECRLLRRVIHIDGMDSPNVKVGLKLVERGYKGPPWPILIPGLLSYPEFLRRSHEWDEVQRQTRLRGLFYEGQDALLFPMQWLDAAQAHGRVVAQFAGRKARAMGIDVAMGGRDDTVWTLIDQHGIIDQIVMDTPNTMEIPGRTIQLIRDNKLSADAVAIDLGGGGKQIHDRLAELGFHIRGVYFGAAAGSEEDESDEAADARRSYLNKRAEMYGLLRQTLNPVMLVKGGKEKADRPPFAIPPFAHELRKELAVLPLMYDSEGRLHLPPKERSRAKGRGGVCLRDLLGRSPDRADSLVLAIYAAKYGTLGRYWTYSHLTAPAVTPSLHAPASPATMLAAASAPAPEIEQRRADIASRVAALAARLRQ